MRKKSITIQGHRTSIALEQAFWDVLERLALQHDKSLPQLIAMIDEARLTAGAPGNLASALRVFALEKALAGHFAGNGAKASDRSGIGDETD